MQRFSPGDFSIELPAVVDGDVRAAVERASGAFVGWRGTTLAEREGCLKRAQERLAGKKEALAYGIALETGKPITEALGEIGAVIAKIDLAIADARRYLAEQTEADCANPNSIRRRPRGVAGVIGPFNFPVHLAHGAITAYLLAGNTVIFKPSPLAAGVCGVYGELMRESFPEGVFEIVQGGASVGQAMVSHPAVRSVCFTGSVTAGRAIAKATAEDLSKDVALELGGKNAAIVLADADLELAAQSVAEAMCLTSGQRCNSTSRVLVDQRVESTFIDLLRAKLGAFVPGDPLLATTKLGPVVSDIAKQRYVETIGQPLDWIVAGGALESVAGKRGHYVLPAVARAPLRVAANLPIFRDEVFAPVVVVVATTSDEAAIGLANATDYGLTTSVFTPDRDRFLAMVDRLEAGNVYQNLPTTFSPGTLPFGGWKNSGNGRPGGRGFVRFATDEQVVQMKK